MSVVVSANVFWDSGFKANELLVVFGFHGAFHFQAHPWRVLLQVLDEGTTQGPVTLLGSEHLKDSRTAPTDMKKRLPETCETLVFVFLPFLLEGASINFKEKGAELVPSALNSSPLEGIQGLR